MEFKDTTFCHTNGKPYGYVLIAKRIWSWWIVPLFIGAILISFFAKS